MPRSRASLVYGALDLLVAGIYLYITFWLAPARSGTVTAVMVSASLVLALGGVGMLSGRRWGQRIAFTACLMMLLACAVLILLLLLSAAYLHGIYNGVGEAGALIAILLALVAIQVVGLLPGLQLAHLLRQRREQKA